MCIKCDVLLCTFCFIIYRLVLRYLGRLYHVYLFHWCSDLNRLANVPWSIFAFHSEHYTFGHKHDLADLNCHSLGKDRNWHFEFGRFP